MINKVAPRGKSVHGLLVYLFGPGNSNEHHDQRIIAADSGLHRVEGERLEWPRDRERILEVVHGLDDHRQLAGLAPAKGWVWHCALSLPPGESLTDGQWAEAARTVVEQLGFSADPAAGRAGCPWIAVHHGRSGQGNDHIHLAVNLVREDLTNASISYHLKKMAKVSTELEHRFGLSVVAGRKTRGMPSISRAELDRVERGERPEADRLTLARHVRAADAVAATETEFVAGLVAAGVWVQPRYGKGRTSVTGYSVALPPPEGGKPVWFGGGKLAPDLTLSALRARWTTGGQPPAVPMWTAAHQRRSIPAPSAQQGSVSDWERAAAKVDAFTEQVKSVPRSDGQVLAVAAREAAGVYAVLWARVERQPGPLAAAVDQLAYPAQTRIRHRPASVPRYLRNTARTARAAPISSHGPGRNAWVALVRALIKLIFAIGELLHAQQRARQAMTLAAAREAQLARIRRDYPAEPAHPDLDAVRTALSFFVPPEELMRRGRAQRTERPRPSRPYRAPDTQRGFGL